MSEENTTYNIADILTARKDHLFVFTFGATGSGKTTMMAGLFSALKKSHYALTLNTQDVYSSRLFLEYSRSLDIHNTLPEATMELASIQGTGLPIQFCDIIVEREGMNLAKVTFFELSGEDLEVIDPTFREASLKYKAAKLAKKEPPKTNTPPAKEKKEPETAFWGFGDVEEVGEVEKKEDAPKEDAPKRKQVVNDKWAPGQAASFNQTLEALFQHEGTPMIILLVASHDEADIQDDLLNAFISKYRVDGNIKSNILGIAMIVSMWDKYEGDQESSENLLKFVQTKLSSTYAQIKMFDYADAFSFSIGEVDGLNLKRIERKYATEIANWIFEIGGYIQKPKGFWDKVKKWW